MALSKRSFLDTLFRRHAAELRRIAQWRLCAQAAEDVVQDVYLRLLERQDLRAIRDPRAYLRRAAANLSINLEARERVRSRLAESEAHARAYARVQALWDGLDRFKSESFPARKAAQTHLSARRHPRIARTASLATGILVLGVLLILDVVPWLGSAELTYQTAKGEQASFLLADGSRIELNTDTELAVRISGDARSVHLLHGEALFDVVHDAARPFVVESGNGRITDLGTRFDVRQTPERISVAVLEGRVRVVVEQGAAAELGAGEGVSFSTAGAFSAVAKADVEALTAWRRGKVLFRRAALSDALKEMSRYHSVDFIIADPDLRSRSISGSFSTGDLALFLRTLEATLPLETEIVGGQTVLIKLRSRN